MGKWNHFSPMKSISIVAVFMFAIFTLAFSMSIPASVEAQLEEPTPTPTDPIWLGFSLSRDAIEEEFGVDLGIVRNWTFTQSDWSSAYPGRDDGASGIDACRSDVHITNARPINFGFAYVITDIDGNSYEARVSFDLKSVVVCDQVSPANAPVVQSTSDDDSGETVDLPAPVAGSAATGSFELGGHVEGLTGQAIGAMNTAGMTWVKKQLPLDTANADASLAKGREFIDSAHANGFKILLGVVGDKNEIANNYDNYIAFYSQFVGNLAASGADAIEVWNEPNIDREWPTGQVSGASYVRLLAGSFNAIKGANGNTMVVSGAPAPTGFFGTAGCGDSGCNDDTFMQQMADAGAASYMDCVGIHYNEGIISPTLNSGDPRDAYPTRYFQAMTNRGKAPFGGLPVCYTELGYLSGEGMGAPIPAAFGWAADVTVAQQAQWLAEAAVLSAQRGDVRFMVIWNVNFTRWDSDPMGGYAIIRPDGSCPACTALGAVMSG